MTWNKNDMAGDTDTSGHFMSMCDEQLHILD